MPIGVALFGGTAAVIPRRHGETTASGGLYARRSNGGRKTRRSPSDNTFPVLAEKTPVRMDLTHSAWSDIFFLGMDNPQGARVLNVSIDLA